MHIILQVVNNGVHSPGMELINSGVCGFIMYEICHGAHVVFVSLPYWHSAVFMWYRMKCALVSVCRALKKNKEV